MVVGSGGGEGERFAVGVGERLGGGFPGGVAGREGEDVDAGGERSVIGNEVGRLRDFFPDVGGAGDASDLERGALIGESALLTVHKDGDRRGDGGEAAALLSDVGAEDKLPDDGNVFSVLKRSMYCAPFSGSEGPSNCMATWWASWPVLWRMASCCAELV